MKKIVSFILLVSLSVTLLSAQIFYKIEGNGLKSPSYIFGSHHLSPISIVEESGAMEFFNQAEQVVGEIDMTENQMAIAAKLQPFMMAPADSTLSVLLAGEDLAALNAQFEKWAPMPGMTLQMLDPLKPLAVTTMMAAAMSQQVMPGFDPSQQVDTYFMTTGKDNGKKVLSLETPEFQGEMLFNTTPLSVQAETLVEMLKNPDDALDSATRLTKAYKERNLDDMLELSKEDDGHPEFMEYILYRRNDDWLTKLPAIIQDAPSFIVVGALHLAGPQGVLDGLRSQGYTITPIF